MTLLLKSSIIPMMLIGSGILLNKSKVEKRIQVNLRNKVGNSFEFKIDNFIPFIPVAEMYMADALGVSAKNHWFDQTKNLFISNVLATSISVGLKVLVGKTRPDGNAYSFPSGHTTIAFANATVLCNEFKESSPVLAYSGYIFSTATGGFRIINNRHWLSDVLLGAGIGMLATELVYYFEPFKEFNPFKKSKGVTFIPKIGEEDYGVYMSFRF